MKGSVILFNDDNEMTIIENVEEAVYQDIKEQEGSDHCVVTLDDHEVDFGYVSPFIGVKAKSTLTNIQDLHIYAGLFMRLLF
ncbi:hypothetical protein MUB15_29615 [Priestia sp. OVS21]|nr:hypothetical protein [Priestia sp. OVS21]